jgi:hypothetical protein
VSEALFLATGRCVFSIVCDLFRKLFRVVATLVSSVSSIFSAEIDVDGQAYLMVRRSRRCDAVCSC